MTEDTRPATIYHTDTFLVGAIDDADDYRLAAMDDAAGLMVKWLAADGRDLGFNKAELFELYGLLGTALGKVDETARLTGLLTQIAEDPYDCITIAELALEFRRADW